MSATEKDDQSPDGKPVAQKPVNLAEHFANSDKFCELFAYGMDLVEETAAFLDGEGRRAAKSMSKEAQAIYGTESMRLTTRLMQLASWLLLQRAVAEGEVTAEQAQVEKKNVKLNQLSTRVENKGWDELPEKFVELVENSTRLQRRVKRLDAEIYGATAEPQAATSANPVAAQRSLLETAFDPRFSRK